MLLYIVRHGDPDYATDSLTEKGKLQAEAVAKRIAASGITKIYSSPMGRARQTAEPSCRLLGLECNIEEWAHEISDEELRTPFPDGVGKSLTNVQNSYYRADGNIYLSYDETYKAPGFNEAHMQEAVAYIEKHGYEFLERLGYKEENGVFRIVRESNERVALFCHAAMARAWMSILFHIPLHMVWASFSYAHTGVTVLEFANHENHLTAPKCLCFSDLSHLFSSGLPMTCNHSGDI